MKNVKKIITRSLLLASLGVLISCSDQKETELGDNGKSKVQELVIYTGRKPKLADPLFEEFEKETGIKLLLKEGNTTALANKLLEEAPNTHADLFYAQDSGNLGALSAKGILEVLPEKILSRVDKRFYGKKGDWIGTSGRCRVLAYNTELVNIDELPSSIFDLTDPRWKGQVGWAEQNGSFHSHITAMRQALGDEKVIAWLNAMVANDVVNGGNKNSKVLDEVISGKIKVGLVNHYYLHKKIASSKNKVNAANHCFKNGDPGLLINVSGIALLKNAKNRNGALQFINFLLRRSSQEFFVNANWEYPVTSEVKAAEGLTPLNELQPIDVDLGDLEGIKTSLDILKKTDVIK